ncbi:MAG: ATP-dependent helicase [Bacteriovoracaceae bacterium]
MNYDEFIEKSYELNSQILKRKKDVSSFIESSIRFEKYQIARGQKGGLKNFLEKLLLVENSTQDENNLTPEEEMGLFTLHSSKGLEFKYVFLIGVEEDLLPHKRTIAGDEDISEERRLFYVGITRAREKLIMSFCQKRELYGKEAPRFKSRFLSDDVAPFYQEIDRTKFNHLSAVEVKELKKNFFSSLMDKLD